MNGNAEGRNNGVRVCQLSGMDILDLGSRDEFRMIFIGLIFVSKPIIAIHMRASFAPTFHLSRASE